MHDDCTYQRVSVAPIGLLGRAASVLGRDYWTFLAVTLVGMLIASIVPFGILYGPMVCGIYLCFFHRMRGKEMSFEMLFNGFDYFLESLIATLLIALVSLLLVIPVVIVIAAMAIGIFVGGNSVTPVWSILLIVLVPCLILLGMLASMLFLFVYPLIVDRQMKAIPAIATSCRAVLANLIGILVMQLLYGLLAALSSLACGIGTIFVMPLLFGAVAVLYRDVFPSSPPLTGTAPDVL